MKSANPLLQWFSWLGMPLVILVVVMTGILTNVTLRSVEENLPSKLLLELNELSIVFEHLNQAAAMSEIALAAPTDENIDRLDRLVEAVYASVATLRETYVLDNMIQASAFHAVVAPAIADLRIWLNEGISGYTPRSVATLAIVRSRITAAVAKAKNLIRLSRETARTILDQQRVRLDRFLFSVNLFFSATIGITILLIVLFIGQHRLQRRERENLKTLSEVKASLQESEELHRKLIAAVPDVIIRTDLDGTVVFINDAGLQSSGFEGSEIIGRNMLTFIDPEDQPRAIENTVLMMERPLGPQIYHLVMRDGSKRCFEVNGDVLRNLDGVPFGMVHVCRDISERQLLVAERQKLQERLHRAEKMEALGTLAGGVAHDLNNVLGVLVGYSELMLMEIDESHPLRKHVTNILDSGQRGAAIIQDLLTLARRGVAVSQVVDINRLIRDCLRTPEFQKLATLFPDIRIRTRLDPQLMNIKGSPVHLQKSIMNLVSNAVEAIDTAGEITVSTRNRHLDRPTGAYDHMLDGDYVVVTVQDTGQGISEKDIDKIFEPFYTRKVMGRSGTGLGLAVVWGTVKDHNGYVDVNSSPGEGSTFSLYFPATLESEKSEPQPSPPEHFKGNGECILVVDDVASQRQLAQDMLEKLGYRVTTVPSGEAAVDFFRTGGAVDLLVLDMIMDPGIDGLETYRRILSIRPGQMAIMVSGFSETERVKEALSIGACAYVRKPYILESLGAAVRKALQAA